MTMRHVLVSAVLTLGVMTSDTQASQAPDDRWLAFQGCWRPAESTAANLICFVPDGEAMRLIELAGGTIVRESRMVADGGARTISQEDCRGVESTRWSANGRRLYLNTRLTCGTQIPRNSTGLFALISAREWVSIHAIDVDQQAALRTVRYELVEAPANVPAEILKSLSASRLAREMARHAASAPLELSDVREASKQVHGRAVEALLFERKQPFLLNGKKLLALVDAGVPSYLVDAVVVVSNPDRFAVREAKITEVVAAQDDVDRYSQPDYYYDDWRHCNRYDRRYGRYGRHCYDYSPYSPFDHYSPYGGYRDTPVIVIVRPGDDDGNDNPPVQRHGQVTRRGYTNGTSNGSSNGSRSTEQVDRSSSSRGSSESSSATVRPSGGSPATSSGSSSSSSGSSSSSSSDDRGKAKPRGSGGETASSQTPSQTSSGTAKSTASSSSGSSSTASTTAASTSSASSSRSTSSTSGNSSDRGKAKPRGGN